MDPRTRAALAELNRAFYTKFAGDFARTRRAWPPGFDLILPYIRPAANLLDVGCGNARLLAFLAGRGWRGEYVGADGSPALLSIASEQAAALPAARARFVEADLLDPAWPQRLSAAAMVPRFDVIALLAVLHHIPGADARIRTLASCAGLLAPGGLLIVSSWQFVSAPRLAARVLPWSTVGLSAEDVEAGDYLLSWGESAAGRRYCAAIDRAALESLAKEAGLEAVNFLYADGHEGDLNLYGVFRSTAT